MTFLTYIIVLIVVVDFFAERLLDYLNTTRWSDSLPDELSDIYDAERYRKQQAYDKTNHKFGMVTNSSGFVLVMLMIVFQGFAYVNSLVGSMTADPILMALIFFGILMLASDILGIPFDIYGTFVIEEKYGFNTTTPKTFILDKVKGWLLGAVVGGGMLALVIWIYLWAGAGFWLYAWAAISAFSIFMAMFYSKLIVPLFNKQRPLEDGELKQAVNAFAAKVGFKLDNIFVIDGSKRSTKANAYFTGLGVKKRIVLYDTLINEMETQEIVAVLAHEIGHYKKKHIVWSLIAGLVQTGIILYIFSLFIGNQMLSEALGVDRPYFHIGLIAFGILFSPVSMVVGIGTNMISRKNEYAADRFACENHDGRFLASALKKLSVKNLSNLRPHPAYVFVHYSHPTLLQRLKAIEARSTQGQPEATDNQG